ncbi:hypothetical protein [Nesterenkonia rhizosphaerae]
MSLDTHGMGFYTFHIVSLDRNNNGIGHASSPTGQQVQYSTVPAQAGRGGCYWVNNTARNDLVSDMDCIIRVASSALASDIDDTVSAETAAEHDELLLDPSTFDAVSTARGNDDHYSWSTFESSSGEVCLNGTSKIEPGYAVTTCASPDTVKERGLSVRFQSADGGDERAYFMPSSESAESRASSSSLATGEIIVADDRPSSTMARNGDPSLFEMTSSDGREFTFPYFDLDQYPDVIGD